MSSCDVKLLVYSSTHLHKQKQKYGVGYSIPTSKAESENFTNVSWMCNSNISRHARTSLLTHGNFIHSQMIQDIVTNNTNVLIEINRAQFEGKEIAKSQHLDTLSNSSCYWAVISWLRMKPYQRFA